MLVLQPLSLQIDRRKFHLAAQNAYQTDEGAFTGEVSFAMLRDLADFVIVGHSERRRFFGEDLPTVRAKVAACVRNGITPILCVGETKHEHEAHETKRVIHDQLTTAIADLTADEVESLVVAYEPVWAISNGRDFGNHEIDKPDEVADIASYIRHNISELYGQKSAEEMRVIYGGSSDAENAHGYLSAPGIDGLLPGGASLNYVEFSAMVAAAERVQHVEAKTTGES